MDATNQLLFSCLILLMGCSTIHGSEYIEGRRTPCTNEGEEVAVDSIKDMKCFKCICQNGFVECEPESCPAVDDCYIIVKKPVGGCCDKCKECVFQGGKHQSGAEWTRHEDACVNFKCVAGVMTESETQCYTPCSQPTPPKAGQCCPTCLGCYLNGQHVLEGREVTLSEDPCVKCQCKGKRLTCQKKACPVLQCPLSKQAKAPGECCPRCIARRELHQIVGSCIFGLQVHLHGKSFLVDACTRCTCMNGTSICQRNTCPVLECPQEYQEITPGDCCPRCPLVDEVKSICSYDGRTYQNNDTFLMGPCRSCQCRTGEIRCAETQCPKKRCRPNEILVTPPDQCCSRCVETPGVCTVFGDPHYKTFDGKFFSFQGSCKYQLTADCVDNTFSIRVTNDARTTKFSSWTKTVTLKMGNYKVNLGQKLRVKINGSRVETPFRSDRVFVERLDDMVVVNTDLNIKMTWDGSNYLQVQVPVTYKNKLCGLCGNYNNIFRDDLTSRRGVNLNDTEVVKFANSWRVGGTKACARQKENLNKQPTCRLKKPSTICKPLQRTDFFGNCNSRLNPNNYFEACKLDMCECPTGMCYCESFAAYARECQRLGVQLSNWRLETNCEQNSVQHKQNLIQKLEEMRRHRKKTRNRKQQENIFKHIPKPILKQYTPFEGRTPPPLY